MRQKGLEDVVAKWKIRNNRRNKEIHWDDYSYTYLLIIRLPRVAHWRYRSQAMQFPRPEGARSSCGTLDIISSRCLTDSWLQGLNENEMNEI